MDGGGRDVDPMLHLMADERVRRISGALAAGPMAPSELERIAGVPHTSLHERLRELTAAGLLDEHERTRLPHRVAYALTETGRVVFARDILTRRQQRRTLTSADSPAGEQLPDLLRLLTPISRLEHGLEGVCALVKHGAFGEALEVRLIARDGALSLPEGVEPRQPAHASVHATPAIWDDALLRGETHGLRIAGQLTFAVKVLAALHAVLRA